MLQQHSPCMHGEAYLYTNSLELARDLDTSILERRLCSGRRIDTLPAFLDDATQLIESLEEASAQTVVNGWWPISGMRDDRLKGGHEVAGKTP